MDVYNYEKLSEQYTILKQMGYNDYTIKLWVIGHLHFSARTMLDKNELSKLGCDSFMRAGRTFPDLMCIIDELVKRKVVRTRPDVASDHYYYQLYPQTEYDFKILLLGVSDTIKMSDPDTIAELFAECLAVEKESNFLTGENMPEFFKTIANNKIKRKDFLIKLLNTNASSWVMFMLNILQRLGIT